MASPCKELRQHQVLNNVMTIGFGFCILRIFVFFLGHAGPKGQKGKRDTLAGLGQCSLEISQGFLFSGPSMCPGAQSGGYEGEGNEFGMLAPRR